MSKKNFISVERIADRFEAVFRRHCIEYVTKAGELCEVKWCDLAYWSDGAFLEVNVHDLPKKTKLDDLMKDSLIHDLSASINGYDVRVINSRGLGYLVDFNRNRRKRDPLPDKVDLDIPAGVTNSLSVPVGVSVDGDVEHSLEDLGHAGIFGKSGSGKSTWLHAALTYLLHDNDPATLQVALIDPKQNELVYYRNAPHTIGALATEAGDATELLARVVEEMDRRGRLLAKNYTRNVYAYNRENPDDVLPVLLVVVDELVDLIKSPDNDGRIERHLTRLASKGFSCGVYLYLAAQHPRYDILPRPITVNLHSILAFRLKDDKAAQMVGMPRAHQIRVPGRFIASVNGGKMRSLHGYWIDNAKLRDVAESFEPAPEQRRVEAGLTDAELMALKVARYDFDGRFPYLEIRDRVNMYDGLHLTKSEAENLARHGDDVAWFERDANNARVMTRKVKDLIDDLENPSP